MENMVVLEMLMDKNVADEIAQNGLAELALRRADAKFKAMVKCEILGNPVSNDVVPQKLISAVMNYQSENSFTLDNVRSAMYTIQNGTKALTSVTKNMAYQVDRIYQATNAVMNISYLNTGLSLANTAVDVSGFIVIADKLNSLNVEVQDMANTIFKIANMQKNEKISSCQILIMRCNSMMAKINDNDDIDLDELDALLISMKAFISEMIMDLHDEALGEELVLKMVYTLMPAYTSLFNEFVKRFYFEKGVTPPNYKMFLSLYDELENENFIERLEDYFFIENKMHGADVFDALNAQILIGLNGRVQIEDQVSLLNVLQTKDKILQFESGLDKYVEERKKEIIPIIAHECELEEDTSKRLLFD